MENVSFLDTQPQQDSHGLHLKKYTNNINKLIAKVPDPSHKVFLFRARIYGAEMSYQTVLKRQQLPPPSHAQGCQGWILNYVPGW